MNKRQLIVLVPIVLIVMLSMLLFVDNKGFECRDKLGCVTIKPGEPLKIAVLQPLSDRLMNSGTVQIRGIELALSERNYQLAGHPIKLQIEDSKCSPEGGAVAALKVVADPQITAIIGTNCSGAAAQASRIMSESGMVMISGSNSAASLTAVDGKAGADWYPGYFRTMYNSIKRGEAGALYAFRELGLTKAATINDGDKRAMELTDIFEKTFNNMGGKIVLSTTIDRKDTDMKPVLSRVSDAGAELIFYPFFPPEAVYVTRQAREVQGLENTILMVCGTTVRTDDFISAVGNSGKGVYFVGMARLSGMKYDQLKAVYESKYTDLHDDHKYAFIYDATNILLAALESVMRIERNGTLHFGRQALRDAMYATSDFDGTTGKLSCDEYGDCGTPQFNVLRLENPDAGAEGLLNNVVFTYTPENSR